MSVLTSHQCDRCRKTSGLAGNRTWGSVSFHKNGDSVPTTTVSINNMRKDVCDQCVREYENWWNTPPNKSATDPA